MATSSSSNQDDVRKALRKRELEFREKRKADLSLRALLSSLHSDPKLKGLVTLESQALVPLISRDNNETYVNVLLAIPVAGGDSGEMQMPWAYVAWDWANRSVVQFEKLSDVTGLTSRTFPKSDIVDAEMADRIEIALHNNSAPPQAPAGIRAVFAELSRLRPTWKLSAGGSSDSPSNPDKPVYRQSGSIAFKGLEEPLKQLGQIIPGPEFKVEQTKVIALRNRLARRGLTVVVAGGIGSGKTNILNRLLDRTVIPPRTIADTEATIIQVRSGPSEELNYSESGGQGIKLPLNEGGWRELSDRIAGDSQGLIEVRIPANRLLDLGLRLIEVRHDISPSLPVLEALAGCDIAVVAVSALAPLSLSDMALIEEHFLARKTPRLAVIITRLDQCDDGERTRLLKYIRGRLEGWKENLVLGTVADRKSLPPDVEVGFGGIVELRSLIEQWSHGSDHAQLLTRQALSELAEIANQSIAKCRSREEGLSFQKEQRKAAIVALREQTQRVKLDWADLRLETSRRAIEAGDDLRSWLVAQKADLLDQILPELHNQPDPRGWWEKNLPFRLRKFVGFYGKEAEERIRKRMNADIMWLQEKARLIGNHKPSLSTDIGAIDLKGIASPTNNADVANLKKQRLYARVGLGGVTVLAYLVGGPLGIAASIGGTILTEFRFDDKVEKQRVQLGKKLDEIVDQILLSSSTLIRIRLSDLYARLCNQLESEEKEWLKARLQGLENPINSTQEIENKQQIEKLESLIKTLPLS